MRIGTGFEIDSMMLQFFSLPILDSIEITTNLDCDDTLLRTLLITILCIDIFILTY